MTMPRSVGRALLAALLLIAAAPAIAEDCTGERCLPTPQECAAGAPVYTDGGEPGRAAGCVAVDGHVVAYAAGDALAPCGEIVIADQALVNADPNDCPRADDPLPGADPHEEWIEASDGTSLHAVVFRPEQLEPDARTPVILVATPYGNSGGTGDTAFIGADLSPHGPPFPRFAAQMLDTIVPDIFERGYTLVYATLRGFGGSGGCDDFGGPVAQDDVHTIVEWAASQPWSTGKVGMWGQSAEGWTQVMALATRPRGLAAVVIQQPPIDRYAQSYMNGVPYWASGVGSAARYARIGALPPSVRSSPDFIAGWAGSRASSTCTAPNISGSLSPDAQDAFWEERDLTARAARSDVPVFLGMGLLDSNVKPGAFLPLWSALSGPKRAWFGQFEHTPLDAPDNPWFPAGLVGRDTFKEEALRWLDTYVRDVPAAQTGEDLDPPVTIERHDGIWRAETNWPPDDVVSTEVRLLPGDYLDVPGNAADAPDPAARCPGSIGGASGCYRARSGDGSWTFTPPLATDLHLAGVPSLEVDAGSLVPGATLIGLLYDVDPSGRATLITRGAMTLPLGVARARLDLYPQDWLIPAGHRVGVLLTGADMGWFAPMHTFTPVTVLDGTVRLPMLQHPRTEQLAGTLSAAGRARAPITVAPETIHERTSG